MDTIEGVKKQIADAETKVKADVAAAIEKEKAEVAAKIEALKTQIGTGVVLQQSDLDEILAGIGTIGTSSVAGVDSISEG